MFLTIRTEHEPATDLGYLSHKHPERVQRFDQSYGTAHVFYPHAGSESCTAAFLLEVDPQQLSRARRGKREADFSLAQYVNDRPYAASSLFAVALGNVFRSALNGRCAARARRGGVAGARAGVRGAGHGVRTGRPAVVARTRAPRGTTGARPAHGWIDTAR